MNPFSAQLYQPAPGSLRGDQTVEQGALWEAGSNWRRQSCIPGCMESFRNHFLCSGAISLALIWSESLPPPRVESREIGWIREGERGELGNEHEAQPGPLGNEHEARMGVDGSEKNKIFPSFPASPPPPHYSFTRPPAKLIEDFAVNKGLSVRSEINDVLAVNRFFFIVICKRLGRMSLTKRWFHPLLV